MSNNRHSGPTRSFGRTLRVAASVLAIQSVACVAFAEAPDDVRDISIQTRTLSDAILELSRESGVSIFAASELTNGVKVEPIDGMMSVREALEKLIAGQPLQVEENANGSLILKEATLQKESANKFGVVAGLVSDPDKNLYLQGTIVRIPALNYITTADNEGRFDLRNVPAGMHTITASYQGKPGYSAEIEVQPGKTTDLNIDMRSYAETDGVMETVVVTSTPITDSEAAAFSRQKASNNLVAIIAADSIGRFPDQNVAAALSRVSGVSVQRDQGQERYINLRGAPSKWSTISFNGLNVISPEGRTPRFDMVPNALISSVETTKAITADMPAESIAGNVNIITRTPFDRKGLNINGQAALGYMELGGGDQHDLSVAISDTFLDDKLGFVVSASHYQRDQITDNVENRFEYAKEAVGTSGEDLIWPGSSDFRLYNLIRENTGVSGRLDYRPNADHQFFVSSVFTEFKDNEQRHLVKLDLDDSVGCYADISCNNTPLAGTVYGVEREGSFNTNEYLQDLLTNTVGGNHFIADWDINWRLNFTSARDMIDAPAQVSFKSADDLATRAGVVYDWSDPDHPQLYIHDTIDNGDGTYSLGDTAHDLFGTETMSFVEGNALDEVDRTQSWSARLDLERDLLLGRTPVTVKFGGEYDTRLKKSRRTRIKVTSESLIEEGLSPILYTDMQSGSLMNGDFANAWTDYLFNSDAAVRLVQNAIAAGAGRIDEGRFESGHFRVEENILALYGMATAEFDWGSVVGGVRVERSENDGSAFGRLNGNAYEKLEAGDSHTGVFPSLHINYDFTENQKFRLSFNSGLARADFGERAPNFTVNDSEETISGSNPYVKPERAYGVDAYYEWYLQPVGIFSVGAFYKQIKDPIVDLTTTFGSSDFDTADFTRSGYDFSTVSNGEDGKYYGLEVAYAHKFDFLSNYGLPEWTDGFGFNGNLTLAESEITLSDGRTAPMNSTSDLNYNTSVYWEMYGVSARVNWQWRTDWLDSYADEEAFDRYWHGLGRLSFGARYQVNDHIEWFLDANNLTDQVGRRFLGNDTRVYEIEGFGRSYMTGVRFNY